MIIRKFNLSFIIRRSSVLHYTQPLQLAAGGDIEFLFARTVAKYIIKSSLSFLLLSRDFSAELLLNKELKAHCFSVSPLAANRCKLLLRSSVTPIFFCILTFSKNIIQYFAVAICTFVHQHVKNVELVFVRKV
jgi:hypothetical protein